MVEKKKEEDEKMEEVILLHLTSGNVFPFPGVLSPYSNQ